MFTRVLFRRTGVLSGPACGRLIICGISLIFSVASMLAAPDSGNGHRHTPPPKPSVPPKIGRHYPHDKDGDGIEDALAEKEKAAKTPEESQKLIQVELVFSEQVTQEQIDAFENAGGEIEHIYKSISYGWNGTCPLNKIHELPKLLGPTLLLVEEVKPVKLHMINATQTGRVRPIWANNFGGSSTGYDGSTNITIGIIDTGVDVSHTDLAGRKVYWYDYSSSTNTTALDYDGHGTHVAGIALGTGAAAGASTSAFSFTVWGDLTGYPSKSFSGTISFVLPNTSLTWDSGAFWNTVSNTSSTAWGHLYHGLGGNGNSATYTIVTTNNTGSGGTVSTAFTPSTGRVYVSIVEQSSPTNITDYAVTNYISSYPAVGDGFNKFRGVAPGCNWAAAKVSSGTGATINPNYVDSALDDMVTDRSTNKIKVINMSLGIAGDPGLDATQRQKVNTAVANGIVVVCSAGNDGIYGSASVREIDDPGRAAYAITVGAMNSINQLTDFTSQGFTSPGSTSGQEEDYKPDIIAPGGSVYYGSIFSTDSNTKDGGLSDQKSNDYTPDAGTSMAAPFVSGSAALLIDAMEQNGHTWDFNSNTDPMYVKMLLCATATESDQNREGGTNNPTLQRAGTDGTGYPAGKDQYEGYGCMNPDAAIEAAIVTFTNNTILTNSMGATTSDRRAWARKITLETNKTVNISLSAVANGDYDLYLYDNTPGTYGKPQILASSTSSSTNTAETISYVPYTNMTALVVVKRVSGSGTFTISLTNSNDAFTNSFPLAMLVNVPFSSGSNVYVNASGSMTGNNTGYSKDSGESGIGTGASGKTAWYSLVSPVTGKLALSVSGSFGVEMYTGSSVSGLSAVTQQFSGLKSSNVFNVTAGTAYQIAVDGTNSNSGSYTLSWSVISATALLVTNQSTITTTGDTGYLYPYPSSIIISGLTQSARGVTTTLNGFTAGDPDAWSFLFGAPNGKGVVPWARNGGNSTNAFTNLVITFDDSSANLLPGFLAASTMTSGTYRPSPFSTSSLTSSGWGSGISTPYTTNLADLEGSLAGTWSLYVENQYGINYASAISNGWTLNVSFDQAPTFSINTTTLSYTENGVLTNVTTSATVTDSDSTNFDGGNLTVQFTANGAAEDQLKLMSQGTGSGQIGVSGSVVSYGGTNFGYYTGGTNGTALVIYFTNSYATIAAAQQLVTRIGYTNTSDAPSTSTRTAQFTLTDDAGASTSVSKNISVTAVNDPPTLSQIFPITGGTEDTPLTISYSTLLSNSDYHDPEGATGYFIIQSVTTGTLKKNGASITNGVTTITNGESVVWTPATNAYGTNLSAFTLIASDGSTTSTNGNTAVSVAVAAVNDAPTLTNIAALTGASEDTAFSITYTTLKAASDMADVDSTTLSFQVASVTSGTLTKNGTAVTNGSTLLSSGDTWVWTPATNAYGTNIAAFTVKAYDGSLTSSTAVQVNVAVAAINDAPTLTTIATLANATEDTPFTISYTTLKFASDLADVDSTSLSFRVESVSTGTLTKNGTNVVAGSTLLSTNDDWVWTPATNANGTLNAFTVKAWDGSLASSTAVQVKVIVAAVNDAPVLTLNTNTVTYTELDPPTIISANTSVTDVDNTNFNGGTLKVQLTSSNIDGADNLVISSQGTNAGQISVSSTNINYGGTNIATYAGSVASTNAMNISLNSSCTVAAAQQLISRIAFTNSSHNPYPGNKTCTFTLSDGNGGTVSASKTLTFVTVNDAPTISYVNTLPGAFEDTPFVISNVTITANSDIFDWENKYYGMRVASILSGTLKLNGTNTVTPGSTTFWPPDYVVWTPATNVNGTNIAAFTIQAYDAQLLSTNTVTVYVNVTAVDDAPTLTSISTLSGATESTPFNISYSTLTAAGNAADADGDAISFRVESVSNGTLTKNGTNVVAGSTLLSTNETLVWTPGTNTGGTTVTAFTVRAWDGTAVSSTAIPVQCTVKSPLALTLVPETQVGNGTSAPSLSFVNSNLVLLAFNYAGTNLTRDGISFTGVSTASNPMTNILGNYSAVLSTTNTNLATASFGDSLFGTFIWAGGSQGQMAATVSGLDAATAYKIYYLSGDNRTNYSFNMSLALTASIAASTVSSNAGLSWGALSSSGQYYVYFPALVSGVTSVQVNMTRNSGSLGGAALSGLLVVQDSAPTLTSVNTLTNAVEDTPFTITYAALASAGNPADADGDPISFRVESVTSGNLTKHGTNIVAGSTLLSTNESLVWTPATNVNGSAVAAFTVKAHDGALASSNSVQVSVDVAPVNDSPAVANVITSQGGTYGTAFSYSFSANTFTDVDSGQTLAYSAAGLPTGISLTSGTRTFSGTLAATGTYTVSLIATDNGSPALSATNSFSMTILPATLRVTPNDAARACGTTNPVFTGTVSGVQNGDNITAVYSSTATIDSAIGTYLITATLSDPDNRLTNYVVITNTGTLTITNGNALPTVTLANPTNGALFEAGSTNTLTATASDSDGSVTKVEFFEGNNKLGEATSVPYSISWTNSFAGTFSLTAKATDNSNGTNSSSAVLVTFSPAFQTPQAASSQFQMTFFGASNQTYVIQSSGDLSTWTNFTNVTIASEAVTVTDTNSTAANKFYRAVAP